MPSAEKTSSAAVKLESIQQNEAKSMENATKEAAEGTPLFVVNQIVSMISNKVRNLEKRKNKLDGYKKEEEEGRELSLEQQKAISKYDEVIQQLALAKEFSKQFGDMAKNASKDAKREARNAVFSRQLQEKTKVRDVLMLQDLLLRLKESSVRSDFLNQRNGACLVSAEEMNFIDEFAQRAMPQRPATTAESSFENASKTAAELFCFVVDGRNKAFLETGVTYEKARELFGRIQSCGYWEKDVKVVEGSAESTSAESAVSRADTETPNSEDMQKENLPTENRITSQQRVHQQATHVVHPQMLPVNPPAPNQVPTPAFNGNLNNMQQQQQQQQATMARMGQAPLKTTLSAVESQYFNQQRKHTQQPQAPQHQTMAAAAAKPMPSDFSSTFSFLQDSELEVPQKQPQKHHHQQQQQHQQQQAPQGSHSQKQPVNVMQPQHSPVQQQQQPNVQQHQVNTAPISSNYPPSQMYPPPGLKVQPTHIPVNYQQKQQQSTQVPPHMIPKQVEQQQQPTSRPAYPPALVPGQVQTFANVKSIEQQLHQQLQQQQQHQASVKSNDALESMTTHRDVIVEKTKPPAHEDYEQQIGTWSNDTQPGSNGNGHGNGVGYANRTGGFSRNHRGSGGEKKFSNYRNPRGQENGASELQPQQQQSGGGTFFRNNDHRYNNNAGGNANSNGNPRYENRGGSTGHSGYKPRENNHRAGSGRFPASNAAGGGAMPMSAQQGAPRK